ncbi:MAG: ribosome maturation factor RimM [Gemmatimonadales bacterium]|nr:MAG: ribosome maturation factor RimM [Gemmatimonadales bacterium]
MSDPTFLVVGEILRAHGRRGEVRVRSLTDHPGPTFRPGVTLRAARPSEQSLPDLFLPPLEVTSVRPHGDLFLVLFDGFEDRERADLLHGRVLLRPADDVPPLDEDEFFQHDLVGRQVELADGAVVGTVVDVISLEPSDLLEVAVEGRRRPLLVPFAAGIVVRCEADESVVVIDPPDGLLELDADP